MTADFSGHYGTIGTSSTHLQTFLFGPSVSYPGSVSPFVHVLFGGAHESIGNGSPSPLMITIPTSGNAFATAVGAGIDIKVFPAISICPVQIDYLLTRFTPGTESQARFSAGVVFHF